MASVYDSATNNYFRTILSFRTCNICTIDAVNRVEWVGLRGGDRAGVSGVGDAITGGHVRPGGVGRTCDG